MFPSIKNCPTVNNLSDGSDQSIGVWLTDNAHGRIRLRRKPAGEKCYKDSITHFLHSKTNEQDMLPSVKNCPTVNNSCPMDRTDTVGIKLIYRSDIDCQYWTYMK